MKTVSVHFGFVNFDIIFFFLLRNVYPKPSYDVVSIAVHAEIYTHHMNESNRGVVWD
jgi:hypothetical protein